jgi:hypothetical protein
VGHGLKHPEFEVRHETETFILIFVAAAVAVAVVVVSIIIIIIIVTLSKDLCLVSRSGLNITIQNYL